MVDINDLRCYIHMKMDCCETGDNPSKKIENLTGNSLCVGV